MLMAAANLLCYRLFFSGPDDKELLLTPESLDFSLNAPPRVHKSSVLRDPPSKPFFVIRAKPLEPSSCIMRRADSTRFKISFEHCVTTESKLFESSHVGNWVICDVGSGEPS